MKRVITMIVSGMIMAMSLHAEVTIEDCVEKAQNNYPAIKKYGLLSKAKEVELSEINKSWLPKIGVYGQVTVQNAVAEFPNVLNEMLEKNGQEIGGLGKVQYKASVELTQNIWDGGSSAARRETVKAHDATQQATLEVEMYEVKNRVEKLYFAILLTEEQISQNRVTYELLKHNHEKLQSMYENGTAMKSDVDMVEAQSLSVRQNIVQAENASAGYRKMMEVYTGESMAGETLTMPIAETPIETDSKRPELKMYDSQLAANEARRKLTATTRMPKVGIFAQAYYGYPGFDNFKSMIERDMTLNMVAGVKVWWNIDSFYTKKNTDNKTRINTQMINNAKDIFLFNNRLQSTTQTEKIAGLRKVIKDDAKIVALRTNVRKAAESQLDNGVINTTTLLTKISDENIAKLTCKLHEIELLQEIYKLKYILNR